MPFPYFLYFILCSHDWCVTLKCIGECNQNTYLQLYMHVVPILIIRILKLVRMVLSVQKMPATSMTAVRYTSKS